MNYDRLLALYHVCVAWHGGQSSELYRLQSKIFPRLISPSRSEQYLITLDHEGYEVARELYGKYVLALTDCPQGSAYAPCACCGDPVVCEEWESGIERCHFCKEADCGHDGCNCEDMPEASL